MDISGSVDQILVKAGKQTDVRFIFNLNDEQVIQLVEWRRRGLVLHIEPMAEQLPLVVAPETFTIDGVEFPILPQDERGYQLTGSQIVALTEPEDGWPTDQPRLTLSLIHPESATEYRVGPDELVTISQGMVFVTAEADRTPADLVAIGREKAAANA